MSEKLTCEGCKYAIDGKPCDAISCIRRSWMGLVDHYEKKENDAGMSEYKRLTVRDNSGERFVADKKLDSMYKMACALWERLAQYEDISSPEEFAELAKAKAEGKLIELPCKVGDMIVRVEIDLLGNFQWVYTPFRLGCMDFWGTRYFLTREAAEQAIKQIGGDE